MDTQRLTRRLKEVRARIAAAETRYGRTPGTVKLVAMSKTRPAAEIAALAAAGQRDFGESYLQEALTKLEALEDRGLCRHFTGAIQSNKTAAIARHFDWVHTLDRLKIAQRLNDQRPPGGPPLQVCIQVRLADEAHKAGIAPAALAELAQTIDRLPRLQLRGLMVLPPPSEDRSEQRGYFRRLREALEALRAAGHDLDTLSMGMSSDLEAAIAEGATMVRIGTALFGPRPAKT